MVAGCEGSWPCSASEDRKRPSLSQAVSSVTYLPLLFQNEMEAAGDCPCHSVSCSSQTGPVNIIIWQLVLDFYIVVGAGRPSLEARLPHYRINPPGLHLACVSCSSATPDRKLSALKRSLPSERGLGTCSDRTRAGLEDRDKIKELRVGTPV